MGGMLEKAEVHFQRLPGTAGSLEVFSGTGWRALDWKSLGASLGNRLIVPASCMQAFLVVSGWHWCCSAEGSKPCCSAIKTVFFLCEQETQSGPSERTAGRAAVPAVCGANLMQHQMAWQKQTWTAASGGTPGEQGTVGEPCPRRS